jgi:hypothetical protein
VESERRLMENILESYLVKLGAVEDGASFQRFYGVLRDTGLSVTSFSFDAVKSFTKIEAAAVSAFIGAGASAIVFADKTAMADQQYRLLGLRMMMGKDSARAMSMATDELGASLDQIAFDPELNRRFQYLYELNVKMGKSIGAGFNESMRSIRDIRMEYKMFEKELEFLTMGVVSKFYTKLGFGSGNILNDLDKINDWFVSALPWLSDQISDSFVPAWQDSVDVVKDFGSVIKTAAGDFSLLVGVLMGDDSITTTDFNVKNLAKSILDVVDEITNLTLATQWLGKVSSHVFTAIGAQLGADVALVKGDKYRQGYLTSIANREMYQSLFDINDMLFFNNNDWRKNPDFAGILAHNANVINRGQAKEETPLTDSSLGATLIEAGRKYSIDPNFLSAVMEQESGGHPGVISRTGAKGLMQLMPDTAKQYGVTNPFDPQQSIMGGAHFLSDLFKKYQGNAQLTLAAYNAGAKSVDQYHGVPPYAETQDYVLRVMQNYAKYSAQSKAQGGGVVIQSMTINVPPNTQPDKMKSIIAESMRMMVAKNSKNTMAQTAAGAYY